MNRNLLRDLEALLVPIAALTRVIEGTAGRKAAKAALELAAYLEREERGHCVLSLFTRPMLHDGNVPGELHGGIDTVDAAAKTLCLGKMFSDPANTELRAYAEQCGYADSRALIAAYAAARSS